MQLLPVNNWPDYELIDSGNYEKLERFGKFILWRPEPQAVWRCSLPHEEWNRVHHGRFLKEEKSDEKGRWILKPSTPEQWYLTYGHAGKSFRMRIGLTSFRHVGIFPEQAENWSYIIDTLTSARLQHPRVLNLFAYTGGASLAARAARAEVVHVDSVKPVITWARQNMEASGLDNIVWVVEDALKYVRREVKREKRYQGIILDPPAYGRGPEGEKWVLEENIAELMHCCSQLLYDSGSFLVLNLYSMGFSAVIAKNLIHDYIAPLQEIEFGELGASDRYKRMLPLGVFARFRR